MKTPSDPNLRLWIAIAVALLVLSPSAVMFIVHNHYEQSQARFRELNDLIVQNEGESMARHQELKKRCSQIEKHINEELTTIAENQKRMEQRLKKNETDDSDLRTKVAATNGRIDGIGNVQEAIDESKADILKSVSETLTDIKRDDLVRYEKLRDNIAQLLKQK